MRTTPELGLESPMTTTDEQTTTTTTTEAEAKAAATAADARLDSAFERLQAGESPASVASSPEKPAGGTTATSESADRDTTTTTEPATPADDGQQLENVLVARRALQRDGWTDEDLNLLPESRVLEMGDRIRKRQADVDRKLSEKPESETEPEGDAEAEKPEAEAPSADAAEAIAFLRDSGEDELADKLEAASKGQASQADENGKLVQQIVELEIQAARRDLADTYPGILDDKTFAELIPKMEQLNASGQYESIDEIVTDAARLVWAGSTAQSDPGADSALKGVPIMDGTTGRSSNGDVDREDLIFDQLAAGRTPDGARDAVDMALRSQVH